MDFADETILVTKDRHVTHGGDVVHDLARAHEGRSLEALGE